MTVKKWPAFKSQFIYGITLSLSLCSQLNDQNISIYTHVCQFVLNFWELYPNLPRPPPLPHTQIQSIIFRLKWPRRRKHPHVCFGLIAAHSRFTPPPNRCRGCDSSLLADILQLIVSEAKLYCEKLNLSESFQEDSWHLKDFFQVNNQEAPHAFLWYFEHALPERKLLFFFLNGA